MFISFNAIYLFESYAKFKRISKYTREKNFPLVLIYSIHPILGNYFASHFIMGGERFDAPQPEAYLFGENADLNFLGSRPSAVIMRDNFLTAANINR